MYNMYPEWGPAKHRDDEPQQRDDATQAVQRAFDQRDSTAQRPDDN